MNQNDRSFLGWLFIANAYGNRKAEAEREAYEEMRHRERMYFDSLTQEEKRKYLREKEAKERAAAAAEARIAEEIALSRARSRRIALTVLAFLIALFVFWTVISFIVNTGVIYILIFLALGLLAAAALFLSPSFIRPRPIATSQDQPNPSSYSNEETE